MKKFLRLITGLIAVALWAHIAQAQTNFNTLSGISTFGSHSDGTVRPGDVPWLTTTNSQRGFAYNPVTSHLILVDRQVGGATGGAITGAIYIIDSTGASIGTLNLSSMTNGGDFADYAVGVSDDGAIYVGNFINQNTNSNYSIYRFGSEDTNLPPTFAYKGILPLPAGLSMQWGSTMDVRGAGTGTQIIIGSRTFNPPSTPATNVVIFTTADGSAFTPTVIGTDAAADDFGGGIAFGTGNTFWGTQFGHPLRLMSFNLGTGTATTVRNYATNSIVASGRQGALAVDNARNLLATVEFVTGGPDVLRLYDISNPNIVPVLLDSKVSATNGQDNTVSFPHFGAGNLYVHDMNSGLWAFNVLAGVASAPSITAQPLGQRIVSGGTISLNTYGYRAAGFQWQLNHSDIPGATNTSYIFANAQNANAGTYNVVLTNLAGSTTSSDAVVKIVDPANYPHLVQLWNMPPGDSAHGVTLTADVSGTGNTPNYRSIAFNAKSNQVIFPTRTGATAGLKMNVLDITTGTNLYTLNTTGISAGDINLIGIDVSDDGAIYACNMSRSGTVGSGTPAVFKIYRWADSGSSTVPTLVFGPGDAADESYLLRWGDVMKVRGAGTNTQIIVDTLNAWSGDTVSTKLLASLISPPASGDLTATWGHVGFYTAWVVTSGESLGRSLEFANYNTNSILQKRKGSRLELSTYDLDPSHAGSGYQFSTLVAQYTNFPSSLGLVSMGVATNIMVGIDFSGGNATNSLADNLSLYEVSDLNAPLLLTNQPFPSPHSPNANYIGQIAAYSNYVFVVEGNNGLMGFQVQSGAPTDPPTFSLQPQSLRVLAGSNATFSTFASGATSYQWRFNGTNIAGATTTSLTITNAQLTNAGSYLVVATNSVGPTTSLTATLGVSNPVDNYFLTPAWAISPGTNAYITKTAADTPLERGIAYNALSNQVYVIHRADASTGLVIPVFDGTSGAYAGYELHTDGITGGSIVLLAMAVAADGSIYAANEDTAAATGTATYKLYRWADSGPSTIPSLVYQGEPASASATYRWGDVMDLRGSGSDTEILIDNNQAGLAAILKPTDGNLTNFVSSSFSRAYGFNGIGRSLQFGATNSMWQKRYTAPLQVSTYDLGGGTSSLLASYNNFQSAANFGLVTIDFPRHLLAGIRFSTLSTTPDTLDLYEVSDLNFPMPLGRYSFPTNHQANDNHIGQILFTANKVYAIDANNGVLSLSIVNPAGPTLGVTKVGSSVTVSWPTSAAGFALQGAGNLTAPGWTNVTTPIVTNGNQNTVTETIGPAKYYRLQK